MKRTIIKSIFTFIIVFIVTVITEYIMKFPNYIINSAEIALLLTFLDLISDKIKNSRIKKNS